MPAKGEKRFDNRARVKVTGGWARRRVANAGRHTPNARATLIAPNVTGWRETLSANPKPTTIFALNELMCEHLPGNVMSVSVIPIGRFRWSLDV